MIIIVKLKMTFYESKNNPSKGKFLSCQLLTILHHLCCMYILVIVNIWHKNQDELVIFDRKPRRVRCRFLKYSFKVLKNTQKINSNLCTFFPLFFFGVVFFLRQWGCTNYVYAPQFQVAGLILCIFFSIFCILLFFCIFSFFSRFLSQRDHYYSG